MSGNNYSHLKDLVFTEWECALCYTDEWEDLFPFMEIGAPKVELESGYVKPVQSSRQHADFRNFTCITS